MEFVRRFKGQAANHWPRKRKYQKWQFDKLFCDVSVLIGGFSFALQRIIVVFLEDMNFNKQ